MISLSEEETRQIGSQLAAHLFPNAILAVQGDLGAGKTALIKGMIASSLQLDPMAIQSPTFTYLHIYPGKVPFYHFDLYRMKDEKEFINLGFLDYLEAGGVCCIEWPERISALLPKTARWIRLSYQNQTTRQIQWD
jgi:tRNA threonylcarbamoyladenosine biosynthesis protein TsaE